MSVRTDRSGPARGPGRRQRGLSLIELMIAVVLGLIVVAAVFNVYAGTSRSQRFTTGLMTLQENGRFGLSALQRGVRLAGFSEDPDFAPFVLAGVADDAVVVRTESPFDCNGGDTSIAHDGVAVNTYAHDGSAITCSGNVDDAVNVLVENVDAFRVLYGIDSDADGIPNGFAERAAAEAVPERIVALRFALLVNSGDTSVRSRARSETHVVLDRAVTRDDFRLREVFATTVKLRNR